MEPYCCRKDSLYPTTTKDRKVILTFKLSSCIIKYNEPSEFACEVVTTISAAWSKSEAKIKELLISTGRMLVPLNEMKHPLEHEWSFWFFTNLKKNWEENLVELTTFNTVEDYWCLYHNMKLPSELRQGQDYAIFKKGIRPMWEDEANRSGGRWLLLLDAGKNVHLDRIWSDSVLLLIGENFQHSEVICGVVVNVRGKHKISVWTRSNEPEAILEIGKKLKKQFKINQKMHYYLHNSSKSMHCV